MKIRPTIPALALIGLLAACDPGPFEDPNLDFSNTYPAFVRFADEDTLTARITEAEGTTLSIPIELPAQVYPDTEVQFEVSGDWTANGTATVPAGLTDADISLAVPASALAPGDSLGFSTITLTGASNDVVIGRGDNALGEELDPVSRVIRLLK